MADAVYEVVWPLGRSAYETVGTARRDADLRGKTVCELWDTVFRGNEFFPMIREQLSKRYPGIKFVDYSNFGNTNGPNQRELIRNLPDTLRKHGCDVVISAMGA